MLAILSDQEIDLLIQEQKPLPVDYVQRLAGKPKRGHKERELDVVGQSGSSFRLIVRESSENALDFSVILSYQPKASTAWLRLRRYNGKSHEHTNKLERTKLNYNFHIHMATERYQNSGLREDAYAEETNRYSNVNDALQCLVADCGFVIDQHGQPSLFNEGGDK